MDKTNYALEVKKVYPEAIFWRVSPKALMGAIFVNKNSGQKLSQYATEIEAWENAYNELKHNGKL